MEISLKLHEYTWWEAMKSHGWQLSMSSFSRSKESTVLIVWQGRAEWKLPHFPGHCRVTHLVVAILPHTRMQWNLGEKKLPVQLYSISRKEQSCRLVQNGSFVDEGVRQNQYSTWIEKAVYPPTHQSMLQWFTGISLPKWCRSQLGKELEFAIISYL